MMIIKGILLIGVFLCCSYVGRIISNQYKRRVEELKEMKKSFLILETKMKYTYEVLPEIFKEISSGLEKNVSDIFERAAFFMKEKSAKESWQEAICLSKTSMNKEDLEVLRGFGKLLGKTDIEGQVNQIELTSKLLDSQIEKAQQDLVKNEKLYKTLGNVLGLAIVILLV